MIDINKQIANEFNLQLWQIVNTVEMKNEGATLPFIARYRKERTGTLDETQLRDIFERFEYLKELEERKQTILETIDSQGKLTNELRKKIEETLSKTILEDLYLPYKPKKRTKSTIAKEKGLEPLAQIIAEANENNKEINLKELANKYVNPELGVNTFQEAIQGASDIIAEEISERIELRTWLRNFILKEGEFTSKIKSDFEEGTTKFETYRNYSIPIKAISAHAMLALRRGEEEKVLLLDIKFDTDRVLEYFEDKIIHSSKIDIAQLYTIIIKDSFTRLMKNSIISDVRLEKKAEADLQSITVFEENAKQILLSAPAGMKPTLGIDPGFRTGCKLAAIDNTGKFLEYATIFPFASTNEKLQAKNTVLNLINKYEIQLIAIGNGTAGRETESFIAEILETEKLKIVKVMVNEAGASIYSASELAKKEFPDLDLTIRGAISIARRLQDPLAELVKIDPKSIGVGQYQHDVDQKILRKRLEETVSSCVNYVGVDLNTASKELLTYVSGINSTIAEKIVEYRNTNGVFKSRKELKKVPRFGDKTFEQAAGFLRIKNSLNILDNTAVHPESYHIVESFAKELNIPLKEITNKSNELKALDLKKFRTEEIGLPTLLDIIKEIEKPGLDPREEFKYAKFKDGINKIEDLSAGMVLEGVVTNITNFGCFVDLGVHQDGLVHISEIANQFVKDPTKVLKLGQIVNVKVLDVNVKLKRINLSIKQTMEVQKPQSSKKSDKFSLNDLQSKFGN